MFNIMSHIANPSKYTRCYHPRHSLAQYIINQIESLKLRPQDIVKSMGYPLKHTIPAYDRLRHVLSNKYLGLDGSYMDKYFTADEFLATLFAVLEIPYQPFAEDIAQIKYDVANYSNTLPRYSLRAEVDFTVTSADNWMSRDAATRFAQVYLPNGFAKLDDAARNSAIEECICEHYQQYESHLPYDGVINSYQLTIEKANHRVDHIEYELPKSSSI